MYSVGARVLTKGILICYNSSMKNKTLKNLIAVGAFAILVLGASFASASYEVIPSGYNVGYSYPTYDRGYTGVGGASQYYTEQQYSYTAQPAVQQYNYATQQPFTYVQAPQPQTVVKYVEVPTVKYVEVPTVKYVSAPTTTQTQYVPQQQTVQYVNTGSSVANTQGASVLGASAVTSSYGKNTGTTGNTGQFVNYDANSKSQGVMLANAYGSYNTQPVVYDTNGVTALTVKGSGSFMPSSIFQWFLFILLILAIIIIARMISKTFSRDPHGAVVH